MHYLIAQVTDTAGKMGEEAAKKAAAPGAEKPAETKATTTAAPEPQQQTGAKAEEDAWYMRGALGYMIAGGFFMWPILILGILAAGVIIERFRSLKMLNTDTASLRGRVLELLNADRPEEALALCDSEQGPVPAVLATGLRKFVVLRRLNYDAGRIEEQVTKSIDDYGVHIVAALERHLPILATVASAAPMLGFLGTVQGMVISFEDIKNASMSGGQNIIAAAAEGIMIALLTTVLGLIVGIPAFVAYNYFNSVINRFVLDVEESATDLIEAVTLQMSINSQISVPSANGESSPAEQAVAGG